MLLSFDCFLRISEVSGLRAVDIVDHRSQADPVGRGVSVFLPVAKTGRRQAVMVEDPSLAEVLVAWKFAIEARSGPEALVFPRAAHLREYLGRALRGLDNGHLESRGLKFVWHSFRHGGASRAFLRGGGAVMPDILVRGRWAADSSGRHYVQSGRQLLLGLSLPQEATALAQRLQNAGLHALLAPDLVALLA